MVKTWIVISPHQVLIPNHEVVVDILHACGEEFEDDGGDWSYCGFPHSCNAKRHALIMCEYAQLF